MKQLLSFFIFFILPQLVSSQNLVVNGNFEEYSCEPVGVTNGKACMDYWNYNGQGHYLYPQHLMQKACYTNVNQHYVKYPGDCEGYKFDKYIYDPDTTGVVPPKSGDYFFCIPYSAIIDGNIRNLDIEIIDLMGRLSEPLEKDQYYYLSYSIALFPWGQYTTDNIDVLMGYHDALYYDNMTSAIEESTVAYTHPRDDYILNFDEWRTLNSCFQAKGGEDHIYFNLIHPQNGDYFKTPNHPGINPAVSGPVKMVYDYFIDDIRLIPLNTNAENSIYIEHCVDASYLFSDSLLGDDNILLESANPIYWSDGIQGLERSFPSSGEYTLTIALDCAEKEFIVQVEQQDCRGKVYIPNVFSPNGDDINDVFKYHLENVQFESVEIYDRFGGLVFESHNPYHYWDGRSKGMMVNTGVYVYQLRFRDRTGELQVEIGSLTVLP